MSYRKRAREGHEDGKHHKKEANASERMYAKEEVRRELEVIEAGDSSQEKGSPRKKTRLEKLHGRLKSVLLFKEKDSGLSLSYIYPSFYNEWISKIKEQIRRLTK